MCDMYDVTSRVTKSNLKFHLLSKKNYIDEHNYFASLHAYFNNKSISMLISTEI